MTYTLATLKTAVQDFTDNSETTFVNNLDNMIRNAEDRILRLVDLEYFRKNVTANMVSGNKYLNVPSDFLSAGLVTTNPLFIKLVVEGHIFKVKNDSFSISLGTFLYQSG
jgi:hypothetical protein